MLVEITDYISITPDAHSAYTRAQVSITVPLAERQRFAEDLAVIRWGQPNMSAAIRAAVREMADRIRKGE